MLSRSLQAVEKIGNEWSREEMMQATVTHCDMLDGVIKGVLVALAG